MMKSLWPCLTVTATMLTAPLDDAHAGWTETILVSFGGNAKTTGGSPANGVIFDAKGNLYGTNKTGGSYGYGTVFKLTPPAAGKTAWTESTIFSSFALSGASGESPSGGLMFDAKGNLYGVTNGSGRGGGGTVFKLTPPAAGKTAWTETTIFSFTFDGASGSGPQGNLIFDTKGNLYGTTYTGGKSNAGTVYRLTPPAAGKTAWTETVLFSFNETSGSFPQAGLVFDRKGNLYGTTSGGGTLEGYEDGTVFKLTPPAVGKTAWTETVLFSFDGTDGNAPNAGLALDAKGDLYGTTTQGGKFNAGTVFKLASPAAGKTAWTETVLASFNFSGPYGNTPEGSLVFDAKGNLYGTTNQGGTGSSGNVFELTAPPTGKTVWSESALASFKYYGASGAYPASGLTFDGKGNLYGTTTGGGAGGNGTVFKLTP
jgi:uncharacterized repeat protein (TIGR03803 family)